MKLEFTLLVVDDNPDIVQRAIHGLRNYLDGKGFYLKQKFARDFSEQDVLKLVKSQGRNYDLVMVDYNLGKTDRNGAVVAHQLRQELPYVDMVFYSGDQVSKLLAHLARHEVSGVFAQRRDDLDDALVGLADTVIGKAVDLNHMRGIALAEVAEMDALMEQTLICVFQSNNEQINTAKEKTKKRLFESIEQSSQQLQDCFDGEGLSKVVDNSLLFSLTNKYEAIRRVAKCLPDELGNELQAIKSYKEDIIQKRNMLAHVKEETNADGETVLYPKGRDQKNVIINEEWMSEFRRDLRVYRTALDKLCEALVGRFGGTETTNDTEQSQS